TRPQFTAPLLFTYLMRRLRKTTLAVLLAVANAAMPLPPVYAQAQPADQRVSLNFVDTDIPAVLRALSLFTQRNYLVDPRVKGKLTLVSGRPVDRDTALAMLAGALRMQGDRKSTRLNSSHVKTSYAVFCLKKKTKQGPRAP